MHRAEVVHAADEVHPQLQRLDPVDQAPAPTHQAGQPAAERGVEPLDVRGVDLLACPGPLQHPVDPPEAPPDDTPDDPDQTPTAVVLDDLAQEEAPGQAVGRAASASRVDLLTEGLPEGRHVAGQPIDADQQGPPRCPGL